MESAKAKFLVFICSLPPPSIGHGGKEGHSGGRYSPGRGLIVGPTSLFRAAVHDVLMELEGNGR